MRMDKITSNEKAYKLLTLKQKKEVERIALKIQQQLAEENITLSCIATMLVAESIMLAIKARIKSNSTTNT